MFIDTHAHLNFREFEKEIRDVSKRAKDAQVSAIVNVGSNYVTSKKTIEIVNNRELETKMYAAIGCHPIHLAKDIVESATFDGKEYTFKTKKEVFDKKKYQNLIDKDKDQIVAIGETGLDYYRIIEDIKNKSQDDIVRLKNEKEIQRNIFAEHIALAQENKLPLILHCRGSEDEPYAAYAEMIEIIKNQNANPKTQNLPADAKHQALQAGDKSKFKISSIRGVIHCFVGNLKQAKEFINMGFYIGVNGIVTFKKSIKLQDIIKQIPLENLVLETDCPFLAPDPYRGKRNEPQYIPIIASKIAQLKNISVEEVENITTANAINLFGLRKI